MPNSPQARSLTSTEIYALWSQVYDEQPNPMLSLEHRVLGALLPDVENRDVLDLGCGTGRWLATLSNKSPASLVGLDISPQMLQQAALKLGPRAKLLQGDCSNANLRPGSADLVLASFVLSHLQDPKRLFVQIARTLRSGGTAFVSDLHPRTVRTLRWSRSFRHRESVIQVGTEDWDLGLIKSLARGAGLELVTEIEAKFSAPELELLRSYGRTSVTEDVLRHPAIYILQFQLAHTGLGHHSRDPYRVQSLSGGQIAINATDSVVASLSLKHTRISAITSSPSQSSQNAIDLSGYTVFPGLINSHDHLEFSLFPRLGRGRYLNCKEWYHDIHAHHSATIARYKSIPKSTRVWFGALRNLLCGVTTVCHHNPLTAESMSEDFPVRVVRDFGWAHSIELEKAFAERHSRTPADRPFIIHLAEGIDAASHADFDNLVAGGALDERTVVVHGLALDQHAASVLNRQRASLIWCPSSNVFLFERTHTPDALSNFRNVAIGSDSPLTSTGDFLDELRFAFHQIGASPETIYTMATTEAARVLRLPPGSGQIRVGATADLVVIRGTESTTPARKLSDLTFRDVHLVLRGGRVQLASNDILPRIPAPLAQGLRPLEIDGLVRWVRAPLGRMFSSARDVLGDAVSLNGRRLRNVATDWL